MNRKGEAILGGILIGLLLGGLMLYISSGRTAQEQADATGLTVSQWEVIQDSPGESTLTVVAPAVAGAGVGWLLDTVTDSGGNGGSSRDNSVTVNGGDGQVNITITGDQDNDETNEDNDETDSDNSNNTTGGE